MTYNSNLTGSMSVLDDEFSLQRFSDDDIIETILDKVKEILDYLDGLGHAVVEAVNTAMASVVSGFQYILANMEKIIGNAIQGALTKITNWIKNIVDGVDWLKEKLTSIMDYLTEKMQSAIDNLIGIVEWLKEKIVTFVQDTLEAISNLSKTIWDWIKETWQKIYDWLVWLKDIIWNWIKETWEKIVQGFKDVWEWLCKVSKDIWSWICDLYTKIASWISEKVKDALSWIDKAFAVIKEKIAQIVGQIKEFFSTLIQDILKFLQEWWLEMKKWISGLVTFSDEEIKLFIVRFLDIYQSSIKTVLSTVSGD